MIRVDYDKRICFATIASNTELPESTWADVRRVFDKRVPRMEFINYRSFSIPWWTFLYLKSDFDYICMKHRISPEYSETVRSLIDNAKKRALEYENKCLNLSSQQIIDKLQAMGFTRVLKPYQSRNVSILINYPAAATFSVPGAGKTTEALAYFFLKKSPDTKLIVVAPKNAFATWEDEIAECLPNSFIQIARLQGGEANIKEILSRRPVVSLISYQQFYRIEQLIAQYMCENPCFMFLDESHRMKKGFEGVYGSSILNIAHLPICKLILSGTPMPNTIDDLLPQFAYLYPEIPVDQDTITEKIRSVYVRTTKEELNLKKPQRKIHLVEMKPAQRRLYENLRSEAVRELEKLSIKDKLLIRSFGRCLVRLIQVACDPALLSESVISETTLLKEAIDEGNSPKNEAAIFLARKFASEGKKTIIWSQFVKNVEYLATKLTDLGAEFIHGGIATDEDEENIESREAKIRRFHQDRECMVLVANPAACGEGISLHKVCHHAIYVDRNYNAAHYLQSEDRIHRIGLDPSVDTIITILQCKNSIDQSIQRRLESKVQAMQKVFNDKSLTIEPMEVIDDESGFSKEDLEDIRQFLLRGS